MNDGFVPLPAPLTSPDLTAGLSGRTKRNPLPMPTDPVVVPGRLIHELTSITDRVDLAALFPSPAPIEVELGAGDGSFLVNIAAHHPARHFVGIERLKGRLGKIDRKGQRAGLSNLRVIRIEAAYFLEYLAPPGSLEALHVYFPDPWPKQRHRSRRLIGNRFPALAAEALAPEGTVYLRTDDPGYHAQMLTVFGGEQRFKAVETPAELAAMVTDFERDFNQAGIPTRRAAFRKCG